MSAFQGCHLLVVGENAPACNDFCKYLERQGAIVCGPFGSVEPAILVLSELPFKAAVLDLNVEDPRSLALAGSLHKLHIPAVWLVNSGGQRFPRALQGAARLIKPCNQNMLLLRLKKLMF
jgi:DNA-binding NtrC family response regulator